MHVFVLACVRVCVCPCLYLGFALSFFDWRACVGVFVCLADGVCFGRSRRTCVSLHVALGPARGSLLVLRRRCWRSILTKFCAREWSWPKCGEPINSSDIWVSTNTPRPFCLVRTRCRPWPDTQTRDRPWVCESFWRTQHVRNIPCTQTTCHVRVRVGAS